MVRVQSAVGRYGRPWRDQLTAEEAAELKAEDEADWAEMQESEDAMVAAYRAMVCALGVALGAEDPVHPMLPELRRYYADCTSYRMISSGARFSGQNAPASIRSIVLSSRKRGLPVAADWDLDDDEAVGQ